MKQPSLASSMGTAGENHFLSRFVQTLGISLGEMDYVRGWKDDFFGDQIADQYEQEIVGAGSNIALVDAAHGAWVWLKAGAANGRYARLWLGDSAFNYDTLDPDDGFVMIARIMFDNLTNVIYGVNETETGIIGDAIQARYDSAVSANWFLRTYNGGATSTTVSGTAADTNWHWHVLEVSTGLVNWYLDGGLLISKTTDIPTIPMTAAWRCHSRGAAARNMYVDYVAVIPRNLA